MRHRNDKIAEAAGILRKEVRHKPVRPAQTLSHDGETAQQGTGRCRCGLRETEAGTGARIYVP